jgi:hypothetical protein
MGYIGNPAAAKFAAVVKQDLTGNGGTSYTLSQAVTNQNEIEVFVNNVRQEPTYAYTASGTSLNMTANVLSTDDFYVVFQGKAVQTVNPPDSSVGTAKLADGAVTTAKIASSVNFGAGYFQGENGATGDTTNGKGDIFRVHEQQLDTNVTIASTDNGLCAGPLTLATGVTLTVNGNLVIA